jgi:hypothetical protein
MAVRRAKGFRLEVTLMNGQRTFRNYEFETEEQLSKKLRALGGERTDGIRVVHTITPHEWDQEYMAVSF